MKGVMDMTFSIGIIEDDKAEASAIMLSLNENSEQLNENSFKLYELKKVWICGNGFFRSSGRIS